MQVGKPPMIDAAPGTDPAAAAQGATARQGAAAVPAPDRADIRPLSVAAALQILIAEVLDQWSLPPSPALSGKSISTNITRSVLSTIEL